jgi:hypothetical protein
VRVEFCDSVDVYGRLIAISPASPGSWHDIHCLREAGWVDEILRSHSWSSDAHVLTVLGVVRVVRIDAQHGGEQAQGVGGLGMLIRPSTASTAGR